MAGLSASGPPKVSVLVAAKNVELYVEDAIRSLQNQTLPDIEILVVDDRSTDETAKKLARMADLDGRIRFLKGAGSGPAAARNLALSHASGEWIAVVDADDLVIPTRLAEMIREGEKTAAGLVADNLSAFYDDDRPEHLWLSGPAWAEPRDIDLGDYMRPARMGIQNELGYLKPIFRRQMLEELNLSYDETLRIGEDFDLVARALALGARFRFLPIASYLYRRHAASVSHRIQPIQLQHILEGLARLQSVVPPQFQADFHARQDAVRADLRFATQIASIKRGHPRALFSALSEAPTRRRLFVSIREGMARRLRRVADRSKFGPRPASQS